MNKAFIALLWIATALLTYWLGLEQGSDSTYRQAGNQASTDDKALIAKKNEGMSQVTAKASPVLSPINPSDPVEVVEVEPNWEEERIYESQTSDLQDRIKSSNPVVRLRAFSELWRMDHHKVSNRPKKFMRSCRKGLSVLASFVCSLLVGGSLIRNPPWNGQAILLGLIKE